ncbi:PilW family protein [Massilia sp. BJB1822]|uniref:PilW family protein n=1 Tax=Massilia sp. BJB1822 TaxID=2744470 RepID=UPI0015936C1A|nr:PilW family protein [Massilia sp. BJB1822]NVE01701.1 PilW family protein [Massilia sp. BJB1822]
MSRRCVGRAACAGIGLAEMMVALLLGMVLALAAAGMLVASNGAYVNHGAHVRLDDGGRLALALIGQALRQAAFTNWEPGQAPGVPQDRSASIAGLDAHTLPRASQAIDGARPGAVNGSDVLALRFAGSGSGSAAADGSVLNCAGFAVSGGTSETEQGWSIFYVALAADGEAELRCKYHADSGWTSDALVRGVDAFQVLYGLDTDTPPDGIPNRFLNASEINALDEALVLAAGSASERLHERNRKTHWKRIASVRVALLLHGEFASRPAGPPLRYALFGPEHADDADAVVDEAAMPKSLQERARRLFAISVALRNTAKG